MTGAVANLLFPVRGCLGSRLLKGHFGWLKGRCSCLQHYDSFLLKHVLNSRTLRVWWKLMYYRPIWPSYLIKNCQFAKFQWLRRPFFSLNYGNSCGDETWKWGMFLIDDLIVQLHLAEGLRLVREVMRESGCSQPSWAVTGHTAAAARRWTNMTQTLFLTLFTPIYRPWACSVPP